MIRLYDATGSTALGGVPEMRAQDTSDYASMHVAYLYTAGATASRNFKLQYRAASALATAKIKNARVIVIELGASDVSTATAGNTGITGGSYGNVCTLNFTPATSGDYVIFAWGKIEYGAGDYRLLMPGSTATLEVLSTAQLNCPFGGWWYSASLAASAQTAKIQARNCSASNNGLSNMLIVAFRASDFNAVFHDQSLSASSGTQTSYTNVLTETATSLDTTARACIVIAAWAATGNNNTLSTTVQVTEDGTQRLESIYEYNSKLIPGMLAYQSAGDSSEIINIDRKSETSSLTTSVAYSCIIVLDFDVQASTYDEDVALGLTQGVSAAVGLVFTLTSTLALSTAIAGVVANTLGVSASLGAILAATGAREYIAAGTAALDLVLTQAGAVQGQLEPTMALETLLDKTAAAALLLELDSSFATALGLSSTGGILYGAAVEFGLLLNWFVLPGASYEDDLTWALELALDAANNLGDIVLDIELALELDALADGGREWVSIAVLATSLGIACTPGNVISQVLSFGQTLDFLPVGDRGTLQNSIGLGLLGGLFGDVVKLASGSISLATGLTQTSAVQGQIAPGVAFGVGLTAGVGVQGVLSPQVLLGVGLGAVALGGLIRNLSVNMGLSLRLEGEIVDYDVLIEVEEQLSFAMEPSFENWFTQEQGFSTAFSVESGGTVVFGAATPPSGTSFQQAGNYEDPEYQGPGQEG